MKSAICALLAARGPLTLEQISEALGHPNRRTLNGWMYQLRDAGMICRRYDGRNTANGRLYMYAIAPAYAPLPSMRATQYRQAQATGSRPDAVRRLMQPE